MHLGPDSIGRRGIIVLLASVAVATVLGIHGLTAGTLTSGVPAAGIPAASGPAPSPAPTSSTSRRHPTASSHRVHRSTGPSSRQTHVKLGPRLSSTSYASYAYQLYPGPVSSNSRLAEAGFSATFHRHGSNVVMVFSIPGSGQPPMTRTYPASDKIYFIEANFGDDSSNQEFNAGDDGLIVTNAQGRIID